MPYKKTGSAEPVFLYFISPDTGSCPGSESALCIDKLQKSSPQAHSWEKRAKASESRSVIEHYNVPAIAE